MLTVDGLVLQKKCAKVEAVAMTTMDITWAPNTAFIRQVSIPLLDPGGVFVSENITVLFSNLILSFACIYICNQLAYWPVGFYFLGAIHHWISLAILLQTSLSSSVIMQPPDKVSVTKSSFLSELVRKCFFFLFLVAIFICIGAKFFETTPE